MREVFLSAVDENTCKRLNTSYKPNVRRQVPIVFPARSLSENPNFGRSSYNILVLYLQITLYIVFREMLA